MGQEFKKYAFPKDVQLRGADTFFEQVREATVEAMRRGIKANSIVINENMVYVPDACGMDLRMVCGLHCYVTKDELPEEYSFAVLHDPTRGRKTVADRIRGMSNREMAAFLARHDAEQNRLRLQSQGTAVTATELKALSDILYRVWLNWLEGPAEEDGNG